MLAQFLLANSKYGSKEVFKDVEFTLPVFFNGDKYLHDVIMPVDTFMSAITVLNLYPTYLHFREEFMSLKLKDSLIDIALKNLSPEILAMKSGAYSMDGGEQQLKMANQLKASFKYLGGQTNFNKFGNTAIPASLMNPYAWAEFIRSIKEGKYKRK